jgi:hypothetical protein
LVTWSLQAKLIGGFNAELFIVPEKSKGVGLSEEQEGRDAPGVFSTTIGSSFRFGASLSLCLLYSSAYGW